MTHLINQVDDAIETAARLLAIDADTGYTEGWEGKLAREVYESIPADRRSEILAWLVGNAVSNITTGAINMLDETDDSTYALADEIAGRLVAAIHAQGRADRILLHLIAHEIVEREDMARVLGRRA